MQRLISLLLLMATCISLCACDTSHTPPTGETKLNVMSFNVWGNNSESTETLNGDPVDMRILRRAPH